MSEAAIRSQDERRRWAIPGSAHDKVIRWLRMTLPMGIGALVAFLSIAPLTIAGDMSFVLDKNKVQVAKERLRVTEALYRGEDSKGQAFALRAGSAVQMTSKEPIVHLQDLSASLAMRDGPGMLRANRARYDMDKEQVRVEGPVVYQSADGYRLLTRDVDVDLKSRTMASNGAVDGKMPLGTFSGGRIAANLGERVVQLSGRTRLHIVQGAARGSR
ncbi:LPS export ABC transporter periplasmic protein LptC [Sphingomonas tabacisoli]|uniref:LPS export ABC transporter periplasmic protein LptC n=1 Tax=Sphingomonas tabacisoli TaxID=2249466 RepID=A0ABW4I7A0_9SPHN